MEGCEKAINITYSKFAFVEFSIQHVGCLRHIVICGLSVCTILFHVISLTARFSKKKVIKCKMRGSSFSATFF